MVPRFVEALFEFSGWCWTLVCAMSVSWVLRKLKRAYGEGWVTETKTKDTGKDILKLIITEDKPGLVLGRSRPNILGGVWGRGTYFTPEKEARYMSLENIFVYACMWRTEINYLENKNGNGWMHIGEGGGGVQVNLRLSNVGRRLPQKQHRVCHSENKCG